MNPRDPVTEAAPVGPPIGEQLRTARVARGWSAQEVAGRLRLRPALIEALEGGDYAPFKVAAYARGQLRNYARLLGLDEETLLAGFKGPALEASRQALRRAPEMHPGRPWLVRLGGVVIISGLVVLGALWAGAGRPPQVSMPEPAPASGLIEQATSAPPAAAPVPAEPASAAAPEPGPAPGGVLPVSTAIPPTPVAPPVAENPVPPAGATSPAPAPDGAAVELRLSSRAVSWVEVTDHGGQRLIYELVSPGPERVVRGEPPLRLLLGNAPAVDVVFSGAPVALPSGQHVVRLTLGSAPTPSAPVSPDAPPSGAVPPAATP